MLNDGRSDAETMEDHLRELWDAGVSVRKIAAATGLRRNQVSGRLSRMDLVRRPNPIKRPSDKPVVKPVTHIDQTEKLRLALEHTERVRVEREAKAADAIAKRAAAEAARKAPLVPVVVGVGVPGRQCQWLHGEPWKQDFCGADALAGKPYCPEHDARCYVKLPLPLRH